MNRRQFCKSSIAAGMAASYPLLFGCDKPAKTAQDADTSIVGQSLYGTEIEIERAAIKELGEALNGPVILTGHPEYEDARMVWNGIHDKHPAMIARCTNTEDVQQCVNFARERSVLVAVRGGGHSWPEKSTCDGGLVIDLSPINSVTVEPVARKAFAGGGNFGVVTRFTYRLHPFDRNVLSGAITWPIAQAKDVLDFYGEWYQAMPDAVDANPKMSTQPDGTGVISFMVVYNGDPEKGEQELEAARKLGKPLQDTIKVQDFSVTQTQNDDKMARGIRSYAKSGMVREITPQLMEALLESYVPDPNVRLSPHSAGGAIQRVDELATAFPHRNAEMMIGVIGSWTDPRDDDEAIAKLKGWYRDLEPFTGGYYDNIDFERSAARGNYGPAYERLSRIKAQYDPGNLFRLNSNIQPAA